MAPESNQNASYSQGPKKRVLFIITQSEMGGAQRFLYETVSRLDRAKYDISVAIGRTGDGELNKKLAEISIPVFNLEFLTRNSNLANDIKASFEIRKIILDYNFKTVFLNSSKAGFVGSLATVFPSKIKNLKVIYRIGGWTFNDPWPQWKKNIFITMERMSAGWKDIIIVNNEHDFAQAKKLKIRPGKELILIPNGIDAYGLNFLDREEARLRLFEKIARNSGKVFQAKTVIGTIANFYPTKGLSNLIETAEHFKNEDSVIFIVIGDGEERPTLEKLIRDKDLGHKVFLIGRMPDAKKYLPAFDLFTLPSLKEGFPWVLLEAMSAHLPIIATNVGAVPEIIDNGKNGFVVEPGKPEQMAGRIKELINNDHLKKEFSILSHQTVLFKFPTDKMVKEIESLL